MLLIAILVVHTPKPLWTYLVRPKVCSPDWKKILLKRNLEQVPSSKLPLELLALYKLHKELLRTGDLSKGIFWAGMVQGLIHDVPTCHQLIARTIAEAEAIIDGRLARFRA